METPFFPSDSNQCGPAALASILQFWGKSVNLEELKRDLDVERLGGTLATDLLYVSRQRGLSAELANSGFDRLRQEILSKRPAIALLNLGYRDLPKGHFVVVTGFDDAARAVRLHSGKHQNIWMNYKSFLKKWGKADNTLIVFSGTSR